MLLNELLTKNAQRHPAKVVVIAGERSLTYAELDHAVACMAAHLLERGLQQGDRVGIHAYNSIEMVVLMMGAFRTGLIAVPINPRMKAPEIAYVLEHSGARLCFSESVLMSLVEGAEAISMPPERKHGSKPLPAPSPDAPAILLYTSGTTARPKGVIHTQRTLRAAANFMGTLAGDETVLALTQLSHASGLMCAFLPGLVHCATVVLLRTFDPAAALDVMERHKVTHTFSMPAGLQLIVEEQASRPRNLSSLRMIGVGGDSVSTVLQRHALDLLGVEVQEGCGMTEVIPTAFNPQGAVRAGSIGKAPEGFSLRIVDLDGNDAAPGEVGELIVRSPANCIGYWNDPEATAKLLQRGWLHTGDLALCDEDGYYWFKGRLKQIIIRGGSNISPQEVEEALYQHRAVLEAGVVGLPDPTFGELPVAFVSLREGHHTSQEDLLAHTRTMLSEYKVPTQIYFTDELPKGLTGKVDRRRLRHRLLADADFIQDKLEARV